MSKKLNTKVVKFKELNPQQEFYIPNYILGFEEQFIKINENMYYNTVTKMVLYNDGELNVSINIEKNETVNDSKSNN